MLSARKQGQIVGQARATAHEGQMEVPNELETEEMRGQEEHAGGHSAVEAAHECRKSATEPNSLIFWDSVHHTGHWPRYRRSMISASLLSSFTSTTHPLCTPSSSHTRLFVFHRICIPSLSIAFPAFPRIPFTSPSHTFSLHWCWNTSASQQTLIPSAFDRSCLLITTPSSLPHPNEQQPDLATSPNANGCASC